VVVTASDSDAVARMLLGDLGGTDVEIVTASLEQAFMALTGGDEPAEAPSTGTAGTTPTTGDTDRSERSSEEIAR
ncbi:MAG: hypothetical protein ABI336_04760, partial [Humibacillus sp.]